LVSTLGALESRLRASSRTLRRDQWFRRGARRWARSKLALWPLAGLMHDTSMVDAALVPAPPRYGAHGRVLHVDLGERRHWVEQVGEEVYRQFLGGYGLGAWLMWRHFPAG